ncbi:MULTISPECIES: sensor histidine kinase [Dyadobacter]|jgi:signal transduction histidine kinase|uniref:histidine kinase n=1 Tax=Dyadobacter chenhuakuii TaxID=2909339 RepID=A0A9X1U117_9BACT|nr:MULTISPECIES: sensor histidine kinase [Dyadobacter]MCE7069475.1 ATP-binding protein [Dyadobacter sp. CY327]MCF2498851.1 ATP-binding protein [Dyadobacter chenhuakuii]MCF2516430.1 ATP-binding protein [Dyadobacter sp. CY351]
MKIQTKIALLFTILTSGIIVALSVFIYTFGSESVSNSFYHRLEVRADIVGHAALQESKSTTSIYYDIKERHLGDLPFEQHHIIKNGEIEKARQLKERLPMPSAFYDNIVRKEPARFFKNDTSYVGLNINQSGKTIIILSSAVDLYGLEEIENLKKLLIVGFFISMIFVFTFGKLFSTQIFNPIRRIIRNVKGISAHNLHQRLEVAGSKDEIDDLTHTFNDMLNRLEITFEIQNNFVSNASHEFRTPLTVISGEAQLGLSLEEIPPAAKTSFEVIYKEAGKLEHLANSMLKLAQTGFDGTKEQWSPIRVDELVLSVKEAVDKIIPDNQVDIDFNHLPEDEAKLTINGNQTLLTAALSNIVLNSCKYSDNKPVTIIISSDGTHSIVEIQDIGIGIPDREIAQIYVPFFRASNTERYKGFGIGLPLANNIIKKHNGTIAVDSQVGAGTSFKIHLPCSKASF